MFKNQKFSILSSIIANMDMIRMKLFEFALAPACVDFIFLKDRIIIWLCVLYGFILFKEWWEESEAYIREVVYFSLENPIEIIFNISRLLSLCINFSIFRLIPFDTSTFNIDSNIFYIVLLLLIDIYRIITVELLIIVLHSYSIKLFKDEKCCNRLKNGMICQLILSTTLICLCLVLFMLDYKTTNFYVLTKMQREGLFFIKFFPLFFIFFFASINQLNKHSLYETYKIHFSLLEKYKYMLVPSVIANIVNCASLIILVFFGGSRFLNIIIFDYKIPIFYCFLIKVVLILIVILPLYVFFFDNREEKINYRISYFFLKYSLIVVIFWIIKILVSVKFIRILKMILVYEDLMIFKFFFVIFIFLYIFYICYLFRKQLKDGTIFLKHLVISIGIFSILIFLGFYFIENLPIFYEFRIELSSFSAWKSFKVH